MLFALIFTLALAGHVIARDNLNEDVQYSTVSFTSSRVQIFNGDGVFDGVWIDSVSAAATYPTLVITDTATTTGVPVFGFEVFRIALSSDSSGVSTTKGIVTDVAGGIYNLNWSPSKPIRMRYGLAVTLSNATIKKMIVFYRRIKE